MSLFKKKKRINSSYKENDRAFTLIEVLVTIAIVSIIAVSIFTMFATGVNIWRKSQVHNELINRFSIFSARFSSELRNSIIFSTFGFNGTSEGFSFAYFNNEEISKITYYFDYIEGIIYRSYISLLDTREGKKATVYTMLSDVEDAKFSYCTVDGEEGMNWHDTWEDKEVLPKAVRLTFLKRGDPFTVRVWIPLAE